MRDRDIPFEVNIFEKISLILDRRRFKKKPYVHMSIYTQEIVEEGKMYDWISDSLDDFHGRVDYKGVVNIETGRYGESGMICKIFYY